MTNLRECIDVFDILNVDKELSTLTINEFLLNKNSNNKSFIQSDADEELLILIQFKKMIHVQSIKLCSLPCDVIDSDVSGPKEVDIFKVNGLGINFDDIQSMKPDISFECTSQLEKSQHIEFNDSIKFRNVKYLAIYIRSNQEDTENTIIHSITLHGQVYDNEENVDQYNPKNDSQIFIVNEQYCNGVEQCSCLMRISNSLGYYHLLFKNGNNDISHLTEKFVKFIFESHPICLDDYIHLICSHSDSLNDIKNYLIANHGFIDCENTIQCNVVQRHYRNRNNKNNGYDFYIDMFESLHVNLFHLYELGLRSTIIHSQENKVSYFNCNDNVFDSIQKQIKSKRNKFHNLLSDRNSKFNIVCAHKYENKNK
eukprot:248468_1